MKKNLLRKSALWNRIIYDKVSLSIFTFVIILIITSALFLFSSDTNLQELLNNLKAPMISNVINVIILMLLFNWINKKGEEKLELKGYLKEIDDFRFSTSEDSIYRIIGILRKIANFKIKGEHRIDLQYINFSIISDSRQLPAGFLKGLNLSKSKLFQTNFAQLNMPCVIFNESKGSEIHFSKFEALQGQFRDCDFQHTDFSFAYLNGADFTNTIFRGKCSFKEAIMDNINFTNVRFPPSSDFDGVRVSEGFFDKVKSWSLIGDFKFQEYEIYKMQIHSGSSWFLRKKNLLLANE